MSENTNPNTIPPSFCYMTYRTLLAYIDEPDVEADWIRRFHTFTAQCDHVSDFSRQRADLASYLGESSNTRILTGYESVSDTKKAKQSLVYYRPAYRKLLLSALPLCGE